MDKLEMVDIQQNREFIKKRKEKTGTDIQGRQPPACHTYKYTWGKTRQECFAWGIIWDLQVRSKMVKRGGGDGSYMSQCMGA